MSWTPAWRRPGELSWQYQGSVKDENAISAYAAAEQLWTLWDQELTWYTGSSGPV